jgi:hypothetical protein
VDCHGDVRGNGHFEYYAVAAAVFGQIGNTARDGLLWRTGVYPLAVEEEFPGVGGSDAKENAGQFRASRADKTGEADNLARTNIESDIADTAGRAADIPE